MPVTIQELPVPSKGVSGGGGARDLWEWSLSDFPQINHFVQSPEDPTVKNTASGRGNRGRRNKGGVGKDRGWERRQQWERPTGGKRAKGTEGSYWVRGPHWDHHLLIARSAPRWCYGASKYRKQPSRKAQGPRFPFGAFVYLGLM